MAKRNDSDATDQSMDDTQPPAIDPMAVMAQLAQSMAVIAAHITKAPAETNNAELMLTLSKALERVSEAQMAGSKLIADETRRAHRPSNEVVPGCSVFNRRGNLLPYDATGPTKQKLKCIMLVPWIVEWESCTREEVDLLNLLQPGEYQLKRIDNSKVRVSIQVELRVDGKTPSRLVLTHDTAFNNDNFRLVPPLPDMLRQLLKQHEKDVALAAALVMSDEEEEALIEAGQLSVSA